jgi:hypothetical protein
MELLPKPGPDLPLTFAELRVLELRYAENADIKHLVDEAMKRRLADVKGQTV